MPFVILCCLKLPPGPRLPQKFLTALAIKLEFLTGSPGMHVTSTYRGDVYIRGFIATIYLNHVHHYVTTYTDLYL